MRKINMGGFQCKPNYVKAVSKVLKSGYISAGPAISEFEKQIAEYHGKKYGVFVNSGQSALEVALQIAKFHIGKDHPRVLIPATTYAATLWAVINTGCKPVFGDINNSIVLGRFCDFDDVDIILPVDLCGFSAHQIPPKIKEKFPKAFVINDACEAVGNKKAGYGDITCLSFFTSHIITTGHGGMIIFDDEEYELYARSYISHGRTMGGDFTKFSNNEWEDRFKFDKIGVSTRESALSAALGLEQIKELDSIVKRRKEIATRYTNEFKNEIIASFPDHVYINNCVFQFYPIFFKENREKVLKYLYKNGIDSRVLLSLTNQGIVRKLFGPIELMFPTSTYANEHGAILPCHQYMTDEDVDHVIKTIGDYSG